jgi:ParB family transcriptional regulator, chromosome partitioning protein
MAQVSGNAEESIFQNSPYAEIPLASITPDPHNPRRLFDDTELSALATSIRNVGLIHPLVVRHPDAYGRYRIVVGERRYRAALKLGLETVPVIVRTYDDHQAYLEARLAENLPGYRVDWTVRERAEALRQFVATFPTQQACAEHLGRTGAWLSQMLDILELPPPILALNDTGIVRDRVTLLSLKRLDACAPEAAARLISQARADRRLRRADVLDCLAERRDPAVDAEEQQPALPAAAPVIELREPLKVRSPEKFAKVAALLGISRDAHPEVLLEKLMDEYLKLVDSEPHYTTVTPARRSWPHR